MNELHRVLLGTLLNSVWQIPLLYTAAWLCSKLLRRSPSQQYSLWVATLYLSVFIPVLSALGWVRAVVERCIAHSSTASLIPTGLFSQDSSLSGRFPSPSMPSSTLNPGDSLLAIWLGWVIFRSARLLWSFIKLRELTRDAAPFHSAMSAVVTNATAEARIGKNAVSILISSRLTMPAAVGVLSPVVLVPCSLAREASESDLQAMFAHELAHVARRDFFNNLLHEILTIPTSFHPILKSLRSRIADSRELVCDRIAAEHAGGPREYAASLLHLATLLSSSGPTPTPALGLLEGQNLEHRIVSLLDQAPASSRMRTAILTFATLSVFAPCCLAAAALTAQPAALAAADLQPYSGAWHWIFEGKSFVTMQLVPAGDHFTGYLTNGSFSNDKAGNMIAAKSLPGRSPIIRSFFSGGILHIIVEDGRDKSTSEWIMTLIDSKKAEFNTADPEAPKNLKPWIALRSAE